MVFSEHPFHLHDAENALRRSAVGGGTSYDPRWTREDADMILSEASQWDHADSRNVVYVADGETIDVTGKSPFDLSGTVVCGGRHKNPENAGKIVVRDKGPGSTAYVGVFQAFRGPGHVEGISLQGPSWYPARAEQYKATHPTDVRCWPGYEHISKDGTTRSQRDRMRDNAFSRGINLRSSGSTVSNCDVHGFTHAGITIGARTIAPTGIKIRQNKLHNCCMPGLGYPINIYNGKVLSELNFYNAYRHAITGFGHKTLGYTTRGDVYGPDAMMFPTDMHNLAENGGDSGDLTAGLYMRVENCTFLASRRYETPEWYNSVDTPAVVVRGRPAPGGTGYTTNNCQFVHSNESTALSQKNVPFPTDWKRSGNEYGGPDNWTPEKGAPVNWLDAHNAEQSQNERHVARRGKARALVEAARGT